MTNITSDVIIVYIFGTLPQYTFRIYEKDLFAHLDSRLEKFRFGLDHRQLCSDNQRTEFANQLEENHSSGLSPVDMEAEPAGCPGSYGCFNKFTNVGTA